MKTAYHVGVSATGMVLPKNSYTNDDIIERIKEATVGLDDVPELNSAWIEENIWIKTRYHFAEDESLVDVSKQACEQALEQAGMDIKDLDFIIFSSISTHAENEGTVIPSAACLVQEQLGAYNAFAYNTSAACSGWVYAMAQGVSFIEAGMSQRGLVICSEKQSVGLNYADHRTSILIGDVATATLLEKTPQPKVGAMHLQANNERKLSGIISLPYYNVSVDSSRPGYFALQGKAVFKEGIHTMVALTQKCLVDNNLSVDDVDWFIYHQANGAMLRMVGRKIGMGDDKNLMNIQQLGNTTAGTIPSVLHMNLANGTIKKGDKVCCVAFGGGLTAGSMVLQI